MEIRTRGGNHHGFTREAFRRLHRETRGNIDDMMGLTGYSDGSLRKLCLRYDLPYVRTPKARRNRNQYSYPILEDVVDRGYGGRKREG